MRYTTVIDISENRPLYANHNVRLVYLHLALKAGYHDEDRDQLKISIRALAADVGVSVSATRHALAQLMGAGLLERRQDKWLVKKWILDTPPTPRPKKTQSAATKAQGNIGQRYEDEMREYQQRVMAAVRACTKEELEQWLKELEDGRSVKHHGAQIRANEQNTEWLRNVLKKF